MTFSRFKKQFWALGLLGLTVPISLCSGCGDDGSQLPPRNCFDFDGWVLPDAAVDASVIPDADIDATFAKVTVLHTTDLHNHASGYSRYPDYTPMDTSDQDKVTGGYARLAARIREIRAEQDASEIPVLLFDTGDFTMGTVYDMVIEDPISLRFFDMMQYTAINIGNHEFDYSPEGLALILNNSFNSPRGLSIPILASNLVTDPSPEATGDDGVEELIAQGKIQRKLVLDLPNGLRVGVIGLLGDGAASGAPLKSPVTFNQDIPFLQGLVDDLRQVDGAHMVIVVSHGGIHETGSGDDTMLAIRVSGIDVILSGHYHEVTPQAFRVNGALIYISGEYGQFLSRLDVNFDLTRRRIDSYDLEMLPIDDTVSGDATIHDMVQSYDATLNDILVNSLGIGLSSPVVEVPFDLPSCVGFEGGLCNLAADALRYMATLSAISTGDPNWEYSVAAFPSGSARDGLYRSNAGYASFVDLYNVVPLGISPDPANQTMLGWPAVSFYVTPKELKAMAEMSVSIAPSFGLDDAFVCFSGMRVKYDPNGPTIPPNRVRELRLCGNALSALYGGDGDFFSTECDEILDLEDDTTLFRVASDLFSALFLTQLQEQTGLSIVPKYSDGTPIIGSDILDLMNARIDGDGDPSNGYQEMKIWMALLFYVLSDDFPDVGAIPGIKEIPEVYDGTNIANGRISPL
jgi:2',3'-cyclic-nucleotide 2'-phosphodiesterase (5'-nucleotidase family)